jgi:hypothetical protein
VQPFLAWGDSNDYVLATGGSFEPGSPAWALTGGAAVVSDNAPNPLDPAGSSSALALPSGASALSPCTTSPHIVGLVRLWARNVGNPFSALRVDVLVRGNAYPAGIFAADGTWRPSPMLSALMPHSMGATGFQVRLTALGGDFRVDDVYIDPYSGR